MKPNCPSIYNIFLSTKRHQMHHNPQNHSAASSSPWLPPAHIQPPYKYQKKAQQLQNMQSPKNINQQNQSIYPIVGVLLSSWHNKNHKLIAKNIGTAFAITPSLVLTCTHNIFAHMLNNYATQIDFYPGIESADEVKFKAIGYKGQLYDKSNMFEDVRFEVGPVRQELCLIVLEKNIQGVLYFPRIGNLNQLPQIQNRQMAVVGYPTTQNLRGGFSPFASSNPNRRDIRGPLNSIKNHEISYRIATVKGQSGAPVLTKGEDGQLVVVGIHTHAGLQIGVNLGLYFTDQILMDIRNKEAHIYGNEKRILFYQKELKKKEWEDNQIEKKQQLQEKKQEVKIEQIKHEKKEVVQQKHQNKHKQILTFKGHVPVYRLKYKFQHKFGQVRQKVQKKLLILQQQSISPPPEPQKQPEPPQPQQQNHLSQKSYQNSPMNSDLQDNTSDRSAMQTFQDFLPPSSPRSNYSFSSSDSFQKKQSTYFFIPQ